MVILLKDDKSLIVSSASKIYQKETGIDFLRFLLPIKYDQYDLREFTWNLVYTNPENEVRTEMLEETDRLYAETHLELTLPVTTEITKYVGTVTLMLSGTRYDSKTNTQLVYKSGAVQIEVDPLSNLYNFVPDESLHVIDQKMLQLDAKIQAVEILGNSINQSIPTDVGIDDQNYLHLMVGDELKGQGVEVVKPTHEEDPGNANQEGDDPTNTDGNDPTIIQV